MSYFSLVDSESLNDPTILNAFDQVGITINYEPLSDSNTYHHNFKLKLRDEGIESAISIIQKEMKKGWYFFVWNADIVFIIFDTKKFQLSLPINAQSSDYKVVQEFGKSQGIQDEYVVYEKYFLPHFTQREGIV